MRRHVFMLGTGLLVAACATVPIDSPTAPPGDPAAGTLTLPAGDSYPIYPRDLAFTGNATYEWPDGRIYRGQWQAGAPHGIGTMETDDGERYRGTWNQGVRHGHGEETLPDGSHYVGQFADDVRQGEGTERSNVGLYRGDWVDDLPDGIGEFHSNDGSIYSGAWQAGKRHGYGTYTDEDGNRFQGDWFADKPQGFGILSGIDGESYEGQWLEGDRDGYGRATYPSGLSYEGTWVNDAKHGFGIELRPDGSRYEGEWRNDQRHGQGRESAADGSYHDGRWEFGRPLGPGTYRNRSGILVTGVWAGNQVSNGLVKLPTGAQYSGPLFTDGNRSASPLLQAWAKQIAEHGDPYAQLFYATLLSDFRQPGNDGEEARRWLERSAHAGIAEAQYRLALIYADNNPARTIEWLVTAAEQNHPAANAMLGEYYLAGNRVPRNERTAIRYLERAIASGSIQARNNLAWLLATSSAESVRDGHRALELIRPIALLEGHWQQLDTLAAAYAERANFKKAISVQERALQAAAGDADAHPAELDQMRQRLSGYRNGQPARDAYQWAL